MIELLGRCALGDAARPSRERLCDQLYFSSAYQTSLGVFFTPASLRGDPGSQSETFRAKSWINLKNRTSLRNVKARHGGSGVRSSARRRGQWTPLARALDVTGDQWTLLIVLGLAHGPRRPVQLQRAIAGISNAVLDRHVQQMLAAGLLLRRRYREMPPRVELELTDAGRALLPVAGALARWGIRHAWSAPAAREQIDIVSLIELLPILLEDAEDLPEGALELVVEEKEEVGEEVGGQEPFVGAPRPKGTPPLVWRLAIGGGAMRMLDGKEAVETDARVHGDQRSWILALGPARDRAGLRVHGRRELAEAVFAALPETVVLAEPAEPADRLPRTRAAAPGPPVS
jgi:DNA-binding HxlR family transcriptional regulator